MKKLLLVAPMLLSFTLISDVEAKGKNRKNHPGGGGFISSPRKRCTFKNPCSRMPELPFFPGEVIPMRRGGLR